MYTLTTAVIVTLAVTTKNALRPHVKKKKKKAFRDKQKKVLEGHGLKEKLSDFL